MLIRVQKLMRAGEWFSSVFRIRVLLKVKSIDAVADASLPISISGEKQ
jgi:hypothetical protein